MTIAASLSARQIEPSSYKLRAVEVEKNIAWWEIDELMFAQAIDHAWRFNLIHLRNGEMRHWRDNLFIKFSFSLLVVLSFSCHRTTDDTSRQQEVSHTKGTVATKSTHWVTEKPLPKPLTNNAVASLELDGTTFLFSFLGLEESKEYTGITRQAFKYNTKTQQWTGIHPVPGQVGRIAATAQGVGGKVYIFSGYTVDANGREVSLPNVDIYDPVADAYSSGAPIPVPVDDSVSGLWRDRFIYLVSGWSENDNVANVQFYDTQTNQWRQATPIPGPPVFGHAGGIVGDAILYCDGVKVDPGRKPRFVIAGDCYQGEIDPSAPTEITWSKLPPHPGGPKYRMAAGVIAEQQVIVFAGGTGNPYNYNGIGYNGAPSEPSAATFAYHGDKAQWEALPDSPRPTMDHRGLVGVGRQLYLIGGMTTKQRITNQVGRLSIER